MEFKEELEEYFKGQKVVIKIFPDNIDKEFYTLLSFYEFMNEELEFWNQCSNGNASQIRKIFNGIAESLKNAANNSNPNQAINYINTAISEAKKNSYPLVFSITSVGKFIKERYLENYFQADAACNYLCRDTIDLNLSQINYFKGALYSFIFKDMKDAEAAQSDNEKLALQDLRKRFTTELDKLDNEYLTRLNTLDDQYKYRTDEINIAFNELQVSNEEWKSEWQKTLDNLLNDKSNNLSELENTYQEKLRLEGPATYWNEMSNKYTTKGNHWRQWTIGATTVFMIYLTILLYNLPESWAKSSGLTLSSVKSTIIFTLIASLGVYIINLFVKLTTSAYHLATDANERYQLTYVYLSLLKDKNISEAERSIVLQSIFSRADTGLLKGDSSPTLPDGILTQVFKTVKQ